MSNPKKYFTPFTKEEFLRRLNRIQGWRANLKKAVDKLREQAIASLPKAPAPPIVTQGVAGASA